MFDESASPHTPDLFEGMTAISAVLDPDIRRFNDRRVLSVFVDKTRMDKKSRELSFLHRRADELGFENVNRAEQVAASEKIFAEILKLHEEGVPKK